MRVVTNQSFARICVGIPTPPPAGKNRRQTETDAYLASTVAFFASTATGGPDAGSASISCRHDARSNCLNLKGVIAIKLVAAPRYHRNQ